ncbi:MAG: DUF2587 domain-containing protein [Proteobacteria bacterium]|nr:DUF2587 domain-containing protein [Pseudomonadota bacterium]
MERQHGLGGGVDAQDVGPPFLKILAVVFVAGVRVHELEEPLSKDLRVELAFLTVTFEKSSPTPSELQIAQAELVGWLEGLFNGIAAATMGRQSDAHDRAKAIIDVEADDPERRRGDEYRNSTGEIEDDPVEDWVARAGQAPEWLKTACRKKAGKRYGGRTNLVIYLNLSQFGIRQSEVEACFPSATEAVNDTFEAVWVLWKKRAYQVWP